jgi:hypothetical protein
MLDWLKKPGVRSTLQAVAARGAVTHEALEALPPGRTLVHLRSMLIAGGAIPARDERLTALEAWISQAIAGQADPGHRQALHGYARLTPPARPPGRPASRQQALILLYAQKLNVITALTTRHVLHGNGRTLLRLGSHPIVMPTPLDALVAGLAAGRGHRAAACSTFLPRGCSRDAGREER